MFDDAAITYGDFITIHLNYLIMNTDIEREKEAKIPINFLIVENK